MTKNEPTPSPGTEHVERTVSIRTGEVILISCDCPIGTDHTYGDWLSHQQAHAATGVTRTEPA